MLEFGTHGNWIPFKKPTFVAVQESTTGWLYLSPFPYLLGTCLHFVPTFLPLQAHVGWCVYKFLDDLGLQFLCCQVSFFFFFKSLIREDVWVYLDSCFLHFNFLLWKVICTSYKFSCLEVLQQHCSFSLIQVLLSHISQVSYCAVVCVLFLRGLSSYLNGNKVFVF